MHFLSPAFTSSQMPFSRWLHPIGKMAPGQPICRFISHMPRKACAGRSCSARLQHPIWFQSYAISFYLFNRVKGLTSFFFSFLKSCTTVSGLLRSWAFFCDCSINSLITLHAKAEGKLERWIKNYPIERNSWVAEDIVMDWGYSSILFLKFNHSALCRIRHNRIYDYCV